MTLDNFRLNRVNSCNKSFWAQNLYYLAFCEDFIDQLKPLFLLWAQKRIGRESAFGGGEQD